MSSDEVDLANKNPKSLIIQFFAAIAFVIIIALVITSTLRLFHNSPMNAAGMQVGDIGNNTTSVEVPVGSEETNRTRNQSLGLTYGDRNEAFLQKSSIWKFAFPLAPVTLIPVTIFVGLLWAVNFCSASWQARLHDSDVSESAIILIESAATIFITTLLYLILVSTTYALVLPVRYIYDPDNVISFARATMDGGLVKSQFWTLIFLQGVLFGLVASIWIRPVYPDGLNNSAKTRIHQDYHLQNWRQYGSWIITILAGMILSASFVLIGNYSPYGGAFVRYFMLQIGGVLALVLAFIVFKMVKFEQLSPHR